MEPTPIGQLDGAYEATILVPTAAQDLTVLPVQRCQSDFAFA
jgi:hypothetical protein